MADSERAPFLWARGEHWVGDYWYCDNCLVTAQMSSGDETAATKHTAQTGHTTSVCHHSRREFYAVAVTPPDQVT